MLIYKDKGNLRILICYKLLLFMKKNFAFQLIKTDESFKLPYFLTFYLTIYFSLYIKLVT